MIVGFITSLLILLFVILNELNNIHTASIYRTLKRNTNRRGNKYPALTFHEPLFITWQLQPLVVWYR